MAKSDNARRVRHSTDVALSYQMGDDNEPGWGPDALEAQAAPYVYKGDLDWPEVYWPGSAEDMQRRAPLPDELGPVNRARALAKILMGG